MSNDTTAMLADRLSANEPSEMTEWIRLYASNSIFRSADVEELEIDDNPYRRPVRPEDLETIDFTSPLSDQTVFDLSALASHRMLLNIYEAQTLLLPEKNEAPLLEDFHLFYSQRNKLLGEIVRPFLESHVFTILREGSNSSQEWSRAALRDRFCAAAGECEQGETRVRDAIASSRDRRSAVKMMLIQFIGTFASKATTLGSLLVAARDHAGIEIDPRSLPDMADLTAVQQLAKSRGITASPHAHWQFYLSTTLALTNYLHYICHDPGRFFKGLGALYSLRARQHMFCRLQGELLHDLHGAEIDTAYFDGQSTDFDPGQTFDRILAPVIDRFGDRILPDLASGLEEFQRQQQLADRDFIDQIRWLSQTERYRHLANRLNEKIQHENIEVDLETFVEPRDLCSTTHVHDDHRLVVIESGSMLFWGNLGMKERFDPGDMILIPRNRLHGSTVISEECTYHQPIIPEEWIHQFEQQA